MKSEVLLDSCRGQYLPQAFAQWFPMAEWGVPDDDAAVLLAGPGHEGYWETWEAVLAYARHTPTGAYLNQDGDLFAVFPDA